MATGISKYIRFFAALCLEAVALVFALLAFVLGGCMFLIVSFSLVLITIEHYESAATMPYRLWRQQWVEMLETYY